MQIYLSYPNLPALDMKWENGNINVVDQANIPKLSKLDNIGTSLRYFELSFDNALIDMEGKQTLVLKLPMKHFAYFTHATA